MNRRDFLGKTLAGAVAASFAHDQARLSAFADQASKTLPVKPAGVWGKHRVHTWSGSPFDIGVQHGKALRNEIIQEARVAVEELTRTRGTLEAKALDYVVSAYEPLYLEHTPRALEEIQGIAHGSGLGYSYVFFAATRNGMRLPPKDNDGCTAVACGKSTTAHEKVFIGQTKDTDAPLDRYQIMRFAYDSGQRMIVLNYAGWIGNICLTSSGMSFTGNNIYAQEPTEETYPFSLLKRMIMEKSSVDDVLKSMPRRPLENGSLLIGDSTGHLVSLESAAGRTVVQDVSKQAFGHANSILCDEIRRYELPVLPSPCSPVRQQHVQRRLNQKLGTLTVEELKSVFADHTDFPQSICRHRRNGAAVSTTAAFIADLTDLEMHIAIGNPCAAEFRKYDMAF